MKKNIKIPSILSFVFFAVLSSCSGGYSEILWSPNMEYKVEAFTTNRFVGFKIYARNGILLHKERDIASKAHRWSFEWVDNRRILFRSSDIGGFLWFNDSNNNWIKMPANSAVSPDGNLIASVSWCSDSKKVVISIGTPILSSGIDVSYYIYAGVSIEDLVLCISWVDNGFISLDAGNKMLYWKKMQDGAWHKVEKNRNDIWEVVDKNNISKKQYEKNRILFYSNSEGQIENALNVGADINYRNPSTCLTTPLIEAVRGSKMTTVKLLVAKGADVNLVDGNGRNALFHAILVNNGREELVDFFLKNTEINLRHRDNSGKTVLMIATDRGQNDIISLLREAGK